MFNLFKKKKKVEKVEEVILTLDLHQEGTNHLSVSWNSDSKEDRCSIYNDLVKCIEKVKEDESLKFFHYQGDTGYILHELKFDSVSGKRLPVSFDINIKG